MNDIDAQVHYLQLAQAFDAVASGYDATYGQNANQVMDLLRSQNLELLQRTFAPESRLLEIGCGTGDEAIYLARLGYQVTATDISPGMVAMTWKKALAAGLSNRISVAALAAAQLGALYQQTPFDGAFASFGSLNCEPDLDGLAANLATLLKPGACFVFSVMARFNPFEMAWFLAHARPAKGVRRLRTGWQQATIFSGDTVQAIVPIRYLPVAGLRDAFQPFFTLEKTACLGLFVPPPSLDSLYRRHQHLWDRLLRFEGQLRGRWPWRTMGDHIVLVMRKS